MNSSGLVGSSLVKVVAAFVTGVLVALVGALTYVKISDRSVPEPVIKPVAQSSQMPERSAPEQAAPEQAAKIEPPPEIKPMRRATLSPVGHKFTHQQQARASQRIRPASKEPESSKLPASPYSDGTKPVETTDGTPPPEPPQTAAQSEATVAAPSPAQPQAPVREPQSVTLEQGTSVVIRLGEALSTEHNYTGDTFRGTLETPVIMNGFVIADKGSKVLGRVVNAQKPGRVRGVSDLALALTEINTTDGQRVGVQTSSFDKKGGSNTGRDTAKVAGGAALGAIIGAIAGGGKGAGIGAGVGGAAGAGDVLLTHGQAAAVPNETVLTFRLSTPVTITERLN